MSWKTFFCGASTEAAAVRAARLEPHADARGSVSSAARSPRAAASAAPASRRRRDRAPLPASCLICSSASSRRQRLVERAVRAERVEVVHRGENARAERDRLARQSARIALAVPALVMALDDRRHGVRERHVPMISAPICGWTCIRWNSSCVSGPGFDRMCSGTASLPMSCSSAAVRRPWTSGSAMPIAWAMPAA